VRRWAILFALAGCACGDDVAFFSLTGLEDSLLVLARTSEDGGILEAKLSDTNAPVYFPSSEGDTLHAFALDKNLIRDAEGRPLDANALTELAIASGSSCGRCAFSAASAPFILEPGDRCALPSFFEHRQSAGSSSEEQLAALRSAIQLERAGPCGCTDLELRRTLGSFSECPVDPTPIPHRWHQIAVTDEGGIAAIHPSTALTATAGFAPVFHPLDSSFVRSPSLISLGSGGRRFLAVGRTQTILNDIPEEQFLQFEGDTIEVFDPLRELGELAKGAIHDPSRASIFFFGPSTEGNEARVWRCNEMMTACLPNELPRCGTGLETGLSGAVLLPAGDLIAVTVNGDLYQLPAGSNDWICRLSDQAQLLRIGPLQNNPIIVRTSAFDHAIVAGDRLYTCGHGREDDADADTLALVLSAELSLAEPLWHRSELAFYAEPGATARCRGLWHDRVSGEVLAFFERDSKHEVLAFDFDGRLIDRRDGPGLSSPSRAARFAGFKEAVILVRESPNGRNVLLAGAHGALSLERDRGALSSIGAEPPLQPAFAVEHSDGALILGGGRAPALWNGGCEPASLESKEPVPSMIEAAVALFDRTSAVLTRSGATIYDPNAGVTDTIELELPALVSAAAITSDELVLLDVAGTAQVLSLSRAELRPLLFDSAPGVESERRPRFQFLTGTRGRGWLSGDRELARIVRGTEGLRGELWWGQEIAASLRSGGEPIEADAYGSAAMLPCGAAVVFVRVVVQRIGAVQYLARSVLLEPTIEGGYRTRVASGFSNQARFGVDSFSFLPVRMSASSNAIMGFSDGLLLRPDSEPWYAPVPDFTSIVGVGENVLLTDRSGNRIFLRSP
jgi:hypothetical protein